MKSDGETYSTVEEDHKLVRVEIPAGYVEALGLLKAIERSLRPRLRKPFVSMDRSYYLAPRTASSASPRPTQSPGPRFGEIVDWPVQGMPHQKRPDSEEADSQATTLFETDVAKQPVGAKHYTVEVREDRKSDIECRERTEPENVQGTPAAIDEVPDVSEVPDRPSWNADSEIEDDIGAQQATQYQAWDYRNLSQAQYHSDNDSVSSDESSVFSVASLASSASDISKGSGYSAVQIAKATQELLSIFQDDEVMQAMYTAAIYGLIGPQKFRNKFRRLLKVFSDNLKDEAQDRLDFLAARLVALKARDIADAIVERYQLSHAPILDAEEEGEGTLSKADDTNLSDEEALTKPDDQDLSDDDEQEETCVDETIFEELTNVRGFLVQSRAFEMLRTNMQQFLSLRKAQPRSWFGQTNQTDPESPASDRDSQTDYVSDVGTFQIRLDEPDERLSQPTKPFDLRYQKAGRSLSYAVDAQIHAAEVNVNQDCISMLERDQPLRQLHLYTVTVLGDERFIIEYADMLRRYYTDPTDKPDNDVRRITNSNAQLVSNWKLVAADVAQYLRNTGDSVADFVYRTADLDMNTSYNNFIRTKNCTVDGRAVHDYLPSLEILRRDLTLSVLRGPLRDIVLSIPGSRMTISSVNDTSFLNKWKALLEDHTKAEWDWWPLAPRIPDVKPGDFRLQWKVRVLQ
jgi:hypothetical protein